MNSINSRPANSRFPKRRNSRFPCTVAFKHRRASPVALNRRRRSSSVVAVVLCVVAATATAIGCGWIGTEHSVRFNGWMSERDMARLPPLPFKARGAKPERVGNSEEDYAAAYEASQQRAKEIDALWTEAEKAVGRDDPGEVRRLLRDYLARTDEGCADRYDSPSDCPARRNSAADQLDALAALEAGASASAVRAYLDARVVYDWWVRANDAGENESGKVYSADELGKLLDLVPRHKSLDDNVAYLCAAMLYRRNAYEEAAGAFNQLAQRYPQSEKREAALLMAGLAHLKQSRSYTGEQATAEESCPDCRDDSWRAASASFRRLLREYPRGRFAADARGWLGYLDLRVGDTAEGLAEYYRLLSDETNEVGRAEAVVSLRLSRDDADASDMERLEAILADEPRAALSYAYYEIYNYTLRSDLAGEISDEQNPYSSYKHKYDSGYYYEYYKWAEKNNERLEREAEKKELARVAAFATRMMGRYPRMEVGGGFALRVAQANLELGDEKAALPLARRALALGLGGNERASALWVEGVAEHRLRDFAAARRTFTTLVGEFPEGDLTEGARRHLAMAAEDAGDIDAALEQYLALDYTSDVAYFVDVLMTPEQLSSFISSHPQIAQRDVLLYSLGVRYLRLHRFDEARASYAQVRTETKKGYDYYYSYANDCEQDWSVGFGPCSDPKEPDEEAPNVVPARWLMRDMKTMEEIENFERRVEQAGDEEAKAEALYQLAGYFYEASELAFYNPAAWRGGRFHALYYDQELRAPNEAQTMRRYMEEHEPLVRALNVYLEAVRLYPRTRAARDALYTAAVIHERLSGYLLYWPVQYRQGTHPGERLVTYDDVSRAYPRYQLPCGTYGWEPLTRTVDGGPGWAAPPKPRPRPTLIERAKRKLEKVWAWWGGAWETKVRRSVFIGLAASCVVVAFQLARRTRKLMREQLARLGPIGARRSDAVMVLRSSYAESVPYLLSSRLRETARLLWLDSRQRVLDPRARSTLVLNVFAHGMLAALMYALVWALRSV